MRIIGGRFKGIRLTGPPKRGVRPTADPTRERLFAILDDRIQGSSFLDLCAGTGAVGIEALSRGAGQVCFVERAPPVLRRLRENLAKVEAARDALVLGMDAQRALARLQGMGRRFDLIYVDPPYAADSEDGLLSALSRRRLLTSGGLAIRERSARQQPPEELERLRLQRTLACGDTQLTFYQETMP